MSIVEYIPKYKLVLWLSALLACIVLALSYPIHTQWFVARYLVNSALGYEKHLQLYPQSPYLEKASWLHAKLKNEPALYLDFAADFPKNPHHEQALWSAAKMLREPAVYAEYLKYYPAGKLAVEDGVNINRIRISATVHNEELKRLANFTYEKVVDEQGNRYRSIRLGDQWWLADNLNMWLDNEAVCFMQNQLYCQRFGKLYTWIGAQEACKRLGPGWRLPSLEDWEKLGLRYDPAGNLDQGSFKVFSALLKGGKSGFEARGAGYFTPQGGFIGVYYDAGFWTSTSTNPIEAYEIFFIGREKRTFKAIAEQNYRLSCRCVRDTP